MTEKLYVKEAIIDINEKMLENLTAMQGDSGRAILFSILADGKVYDLTDKEVRAYAIKPDKTKVFSNLEVLYAERGLAELRLTNQLLAVPGKIKLILVISKENATLSSKVVLLNVEPTLMDDAAIESTDSFSTFQQTLANATEVEKRFGEMLDRLDDIVDADLINEIVTEYIQTNGVKLTEKSVKDIVQDSIDQGEITVPVSQTQIETSIKNYLEENPPTGVNEKEVVNIVNKAIENNEISVESGYTKEALDTKFADIEEKVNPFKINSFTLNPSVVERGTTVKVTANWSYNKDITEQKLNNEVIENSIRTKEISLAADTTFTLKAKSTGGIEKISTANVKFVNPSYYGVVDTTTPTAAVIKTLTKKIKDGKALTYDNISLSDKRTCYAYPKTFGEVSSIKDGNGFDIKNSFTKSEIKIDEVDYIVYVLTDAVTVENAKQIFA